MDIVDTILIENRSLDLKEVLHQVQHGKDTAYERIYAAQREKHITYDDIEEAMSGIGTATGVRFKRYIVPQGPVSRFDITGEGVALDTNGLDSLVYTSQEGMDAEAPHITLTLKDCTRTHYCHGSIGEDDIERSTRVSLHMSTERQNALKYHSLITDYLSILG